jgi:antitoxin (DNA-binding transcriptional repressor) of toxin-antitoxin stability system
MRAIRKLSLSEFKVHLSRYLREVKAGEGLILLERGHAIAEVRPFSSEATRPLEKLTALPPRREKGPKPLRLKRVPELSDLDGVELLRWRFGIFSLKKKR